MSKLYEVVENKLILHLHAGQQQAWESKRRFVGVVAGTQSGKTSFAPLWLWREIRERGPGDYGFVCPTFTLMELKALPEFRRLFEDVLALGRYTSSPIRKFVFSSEGSQRIFGHRPDVRTHVYFGYAENPNSLESSTYKAVVCDEAGQKVFRRESWEALIRRLSIHQGRALITTTPYSSGGWLRTEIYDRWRNGDSDIEFIRFASSMNPSFPQEEFERARRTMPDWKFSLFYNGQFARPAGLIYDSFDEGKHKVKRFPIPDAWRKYLGLDFGGVNTAAVFYAEDPKTKNLYAYREYKAGQRTAAEHVYHLLRGAKSIPVCVGGSKSEGQWRMEFAAGGKVFGIPGFPNGIEVAGLPVREPDQPDVEVGIDRVYGAFKRDELYIFDDLHGLLEELLTYSREVDEAGEPTEKIESKETFHFADATRYIIGSLKKSRRPWKLGEYA